MKQSTDAGWCVAQPSYADNYLSKGDFWLYCENKKPTAAIRLTGDKDIAEIRVASQKIEADTEALASQLVTDPILLRDRQTKRDSVPAPDSGLGWLTSDLIMTIIMALLGVSSLKHGGQMVGGLAGVISKVRNKDK